MSNNSEKKSNNSDNQPENKNPDNKAENSEKRNPYELYLVCKSNISIRQGDSPSQPLNKAADFYVGDIFQAKVSIDHSDYIQLRAASKANKKQWIDIAERNGNDENDNTSIMNIFPPSINEYFHLDIGNTSTSKCKHLINILLKYIEEIHSISFLKPLCGVIITYLPFSYPVFTINGTLFRGRGHFTQFAVPYFHTKSHCKAFLRRIEELRKEIISKLNDAVIDNKLAKQLEYEYEKKLMLEYNRRMRFEYLNDPEMKNEYENMAVDEKEEEEEDIKQNELLDAEYINKIVSVQKGKLPNWISSIYESISSINSYYYCIELYFMDNDCMVPFKKDEYLEQNKYLDFIIQNKSDTNDNNNPKKKLWSKPQLMAYKIGDNLEDMIDVNHAGGSRWFDIEFNPKEALTDDECKIFDENVEIYRCKVGGKWQGDSRSRHYIDVKNKNGDIFSKYLPMIVINLVL